MQHNENLYILLDKIFGNEELLTKFARLDSIEDIYDFSITVQDGYTKDEFALFFDDMLTTVIDENYIANFKKMSETDMEKISGGKNMNLKNFMAMGLASLTMVATPINIQGVEVDSTNSQSAQSTQVSVKSKRPKKKYKKEDNPSPLTKLKNKLKSVANFVLEHPVPFTLGAVALAVGGAAVYKWSTGSKDNSKALSDANKAVIDNLQKTIDDLKSSDSDNVSAETLRQYEISVAPGTNNIRRSLAIQRLIEKRNALEKNNSLIKGTLSNITDKIPALGYAAAGIGGMTTAAKSIWDLVQKGITTTGGISKNINDISMLKYSLDNLSNIGQKWVDEQAEQLNKKTFDKLEAREKLKAGFAKVRGQETAKSKIQAFFDAVVMTRQKVEATGEKFPHAHVILFNGPSGNGKTFTATHLARAISTAEPYIMSASMVNPFSSAKDIVSQLFYGNSPKSMSSRGYNGMDYSEPTNFIRYLEKHPKDGVVIINEYDKMCNLNSNNVHPLDETFRTLIDDGKINVYNKEIDCSGVVFILTTNETDGSIDGKVTVDPITNKLFDPTIHDDTTGSRTIVRHDKSFLNRLTKVKFENLTKNEYKQIAKDNFTATIQFFKSEVGGNINIKISDESYDKIAEYAQNKDEGARSLDKVLQSFYRDIAEVLSKFEQDEEDYEGMSFEAIYDLDDNKFKIVEIADK